MTLPGVEAIRPTAHGLHTAHYRHPHLSAWTLSSIGTCVADRPLIHSRRTWREPPIPAWHPESCAGRAVVLLDCTFTKWFVVPRAIVPVTIGPDTSGIPLHLLLGRRGSGFLVGVVLLLYLTNRRIIHVVDTQIVAIGRIHPVGVASCCVAQRHARGKRNLRLSIGYSSIVARFDVARYRVTLPLGASSNHEIRWQLTAKFNACILNGVCCMLQIRLGRTVLRRHAHLLINRHANRRKNANDDHDNKQLNESKTRLSRGTPPQGLIHTTHGFTSLSSCKPAVGSAE